MVHISPYVVTERLFPGVAKYIKLGGKLVLYGAMKVGGKCTTPSNDEFDESLKRRNPLWGIRDFEDLDKRAKEAGFEFVVREEMPANNFFCVWKKSR